MQENRTTNEESEARAGGPSHDASGVSGRVLGIVAALAGAVVWMLVAMMFRMRVKMLAIAIGAVVGSFCRNDVRETDNSTNVPLHASLIAAFGAFVGEYLVVTALLPEIGTSLGHTFSAPLSIGDFFYIFTATAPNVYHFVVPVSGVFAAGYIPLARMQALAHQHNARVARAEAQRESLRERIERVEAMAKPKATGMARVSCELCRELVDASTTTKVDGLGIVCAPCLAARDGK